MECKKERCKNIISKSYSCSRCELKFCSSSCMIDHFFTKHEKETNDYTEIKNSPVGMIKNSKITELKNNKRNSDYDSIFLKKGEILKDIKLVSYFDFENFEKVRVGKKIYLLGTGAFGEVYMVKHKKDGKSFAVKQMDKNRILNTGVSLEIIRREIDIHCRLIHENIIRLYSFHEDSNSFYLLMEYADSGSLFRKIRKNKALSERDAFKYFIQTAAAVYFIHENNLIHRDIKPENLLLDDKDNIKLCDFGWCIELEIGNRNTVCGTPEYMAPEIIREMPYDKSIDIWSLGVLLYELLHGYSPFRANNENGEENNTQVMKNIIKNALKIDRTDLKNTCSDLITKLLVSDKNSRLKIKDIFSHPWVVEFEKELLSPNESISNNNNILRNVSPIPISRKITTEKSVENTLNPKKDSNPDIKSILNPITKRESCNVLAANPENKDIHKQDIDLVYKKLDFTKEVSISTNADDFIGITEKTDSLFDKVLIQVKEKNKDKRKRSKYLDEGDNDSIRYKNVEQHYLKKGEGGRKRSCDVISKKNEYKMLNDIQEIDNKIEKQIKDNNMKYESFQIKKDEFNKAIEKNKLERDASEKVKMLVKGELDPDNDNFCIFNENNYDSPSINKNKMTSNNNLKKIILKSNVQANRSLNDGSGITKKRIEDQSVIISQNYPPMRLKSNSNYNSQLTLVNISQESYKRTNQFLTVNKKPNFNRELDLSFVPKDLLYNDKTYEQSNQNLLSAIEILEKAQEETACETAKPKTFWDFINPFKCG